MSESDDPMTQMTIYIRTSAKRKFKAMAAIRGVSLGKLVEQIVAEDEAQQSHDARSHK